MVSNYAASSVNILVLQIATSCFYSVLRMEIMGIVSIIAQEIRVRQGVLWPEDLKGVLGPEMSRAWGCLI